MPPSCKVVSTAGQLYTFLPANFSFLPPVEDLTFHLLLRLRPHLHQTGGADNRSGTRPVDRASHVHAGNRPSVDRVSPGCARLACAACPSGGVPDSGERSPQPAGNT